MAWGRLALAGVLVAVATAGTAAAATRMWQPPLTITPRGAEPGDPSAAAGTGGEALAAFATTIRGRSRVEARVRDEARAPWVRLVLSGTFPTAPRPPAAAIEPAGRAAVVWRVPGGAIRSAVRDRPGGDWRVIPVAPGGAVDDGFGFRGAVATMDGTDRSAALVWAERAAGVWTVRAARRAGPGAAWAETLPLPLGPGAAEPSLALSPDGTAVATWTVPSGTGPFATGPLHAAVRSTDGAWTAVTPLASGAARIPSAAAGYDGRAAVAWEDLTAATPSVVVAEAGLGTSWGAAQAVAPGQAPRVAANAAGDLVLSWAGNGTPQAPQATPILAAVKPSGAPWPAGIELTPGTGLTSIEASLARVAIGGTGRAFVAFLDQEGPGSATVTLAAARAGESWTTAPVRVGGDLFGVGLSASSGGNGLAVLPSESADGAFLQAADFDGYLRPVVTAGLAGVRRADGTTAWTAVVRNRGRVAAQGVRLRLAICCGTRLLAARPGGTRSGRFVTWTVPRLAPGRTSTIRLTLRHPPGSSGRLSGSLSAVAVPPAPVSAVPRR
ncbi:MAG TPA: hypothetical protein VK904_07450 [Miltoncostaeaceae bacterium]|nr:hypothetical protein [Miltoncostaeaceae bacterium]